MRFTISLAVVAAISFTSNVCVLADGPESRPAQSPTETKVEPYNFSFRPAASDGIHAVICIRPALLVSQPGMAPHLQRIRKEWDDFQVQRKCQPLPDGLTLADVDQIVCDLARRDNDRIAHVTDSSGWVNANFASNYFVAHLRRDVDWEKVLTALFGKVSTIKQGGHFIYTIRIPAISDDWRMDFCAIDARTLVRVSRPATVLPVFGLGMLPICPLTTTLNQTPFVIPSRGEKKVIELGAAWTKVEHLPLAIGFDNHDSYWTNPVASAPKRIADLVRIFNAADSLCAGAGFGPGLEERIAIQGKGEAQAVEAIAAMEGFAKMVKDEVLTKQEKGKNAPLDELGKQMWDEMVKSMKVERKGALVRVSSHLDVTCADLFAQLDREVDSDEAVNRGGELIEKQEYDKAIKEYDEAIRLNPGNACAFLSRGRAWHLKKDLDKAIADYNEAIRLEPENADAFQNRGRAWYSKCEYDKAIKDDDAVIHLNSNDASAFQDRGDARYCMKEFDKAIKDYDEAIHLAPKDPGHFYSRALAWGKKRDLDRAIKDFGEVIKLNPEYAGAFYYRASTWLAKKEYDKAINDFNQAIRLDPKVADKFARRGSTWLAKKEYDTAIKDYDEAIRLDPKDADNFSCRGIGWGIQKQYGKAIKDFEDAVRLDPKDSYPVIYGYLTARAAGNEARAARFLKDAVGKLDESDWPYPVIKYLRGEIDEPALIKLAIDDDKLTEVHCYLGLDDLSKGRKNEAIANFQWVKERGAAGNIEYAIAIAELERLKASAAKSKP
jgi:tetratricopeptide (TPR) repeat protein